MKEHARASIIFILTCVYMNIMHKLHKNYTSCECEYKGHQHCLWLDKRGACIYKYYGIISTIVHILICMFFNAAVYTRRLVYIYRYCIFKHINKSFHKRSSKSMLFDEYTITHTYIYTHVYEQCQLRIYFVHRLLHVLVSTGRPQIQVSTLL